MARPESPVLQVVLGLNPGGTERLVVELVRRLRSTFPMAVCCLDQRGSWGAALAAEGVPVIELHREPGFHPGLAMAVRRAAEQTGARVLHCHQYSPFVYAAIGRGLSPGLRVLFTEHGRLNDAPPSTKRRLVNPFLGRAAHRIFSVSDDLRQHMIAEGLPASRIEIVRNGVDPVAPGDSTRQELRHSLGLDDATVLITIARLDPVKDLVTLLHAVQRIRHEHPDAALIIVGDGPERSALERKAATLGLDRAVTFLGHRDDAREWLAAADVYVSSSVSEGISLTILEGMAAGLPIVATAVGGTPEIVDESCGRLVPARDAAALATAVAALVNDPVLRTRLGQASRARVLSSFTLDRMVAAYRRVYEEAS